MLEQINTLVFMIHTEVKSRFSDGCQVTFPSNCGEKVWKFTNISNRHFSGLKRLLTNELNRSVPPAGKSRGRCKTSLPIKLRCILFSFFPDVASHELTVNMQDGHASQAKCCWTEKSTGTLYKLYCCWLCSKGGAKVWGRIQRFADTSRTAETAPKKQRCRYESWL